LAAIERFSINEKAPSVSGEASRLLRELQRNQRARTLDALPWRAFAVGLRVERFTARTLAQSSRKVKGIPPAATIEVRVDSSDALTIGAPSSGELQGANGHARGTGLPLTVDVV
jgi:hypothetical protein